VPQATVFVCLYNPAGNKVDTVSTLDLIKNLGERKHPNSNILNDDGNMIFYYKYTIYGMPWKYLTSFFIPGESRKA